MTGSGTAAPTPGRPEAEPAGRRAPGARPLPAPTDARARGAVRAALAALLAVGAALRLAHLASERSLWLDEAMLALNIAGRSLAGLTRTLDYGQTAPLLFLWAERLVVRGVGVSETALRLLPFAAGVLLPAVLWTVARRLLPPGGALLAVALAALSPTLVYYSSEVKPYGTDALVTVLLALAALRTMERPADGRRWAALAAGGALAVWASTPSVFVLAGVGLALLLSPAARGAPGFLPRLVGTGTVWAASVALAFLAYHRSMAENGYMQRYWDRAFLDVGPALAAVRLARGLGSTLLASLVREQEFATALSTRASTEAALAAALCVVGVAVLARRRSGLGSSAAALLLGPIAAACAAAALRRYPLAARLMTYATPLVILAAAAGAAWLAARAAALVARLRTRGAAGSGGALPDAPARAPLTAVATGLIAALVLAPAAREAVGRLRAPAHAARVREAAQALERRRAPGEPVFVSPFALAQWVYYSTDWERPDTARLRYVADAARPPDGPAFYNRVWPAPGVERPGASPAPIPAPSYDGPRGRELYGMSSRTQATLGRPRVPPAGWGEREARRVREAARPCAWLFLNSMVEQERASLDRALGALGGRPTFRYAHRAAETRRVCFPP